MSKKMIQLAILQEDPINPRQITPAAFADLKESLKNFPEMMEKNQIVIRSWQDPKVIRGNKRLKALRELGYQEIPASWVISAEGWTEEQIREFMIRDNVHAGTWDQKKLTSWDPVKLSTWGVNVTQWNTRKAVEQEIKEREDVKLSATITAGQNEFLEELVKNKTASSIGGSRGKLMNAVQWCINECMKK